MIKVPIYFLYFIGAVNVCKQNIKTIGVEGTITGSFTADQLNNDDYECILQFNDVPLNSVLELNINRNRYPYYCFGARGNYLRFKGFTRTLYLCASSPSRVYGYRNTTENISMRPEIRDIAHVQLNLTYKGKSGF